MSATQNVRAEPQIAQDGASSEATPALRPEREYRWHSSRMRGAQ
jgi:hypothetical protein